ncbi:GH1 family beta-glucosidase [Rubrivirga sp.]|uniref:GH1 family beta-glucosidase n=1 Tax=Rubrivirga sp. TaxID=1885344 RepID=UPI003B52700B
MPFPDDFLWGAATSAFQIEGSPLADGAGPSIWQRFADTPGRMVGNETGDVACDHYNRMPSDVALMADLGLQAYRFSVAWGRVLPDGTGTVNGPGLDFYDRLVDRLGQAGIEPMLTLYHWDLPAALDDRGGWLNRDIADWLADYARVVHQRLGDRVTRWITLNEPWVTMDGGYVRGGLAPGHRVHREGAMAAHHQLLAHARATAALRAEGAGQVGLAVNLEPKVAATDKPEDVAATARADAYMNRIFLDPVVHGRYPEGLPEVFGASWPGFADADLDEIQTDTDFFGVNYYTRAVIVDDPADPPEEARRVRQTRHPYTEMGWEVYAPALRDLLVWVKDEYGDTPLFITENGSAFYDPPQVVGGEVPDPMRVAYLHDHLLAVEDAIEAGVDVRGYFAWSLLDNVEWAQGTSKRFGIVHVDFETLERTPKHSAAFYREVIGSNGAALGDAPRIPTTDEVTATARRSAASLQEGAG